MIDWSSDQIVYGTQTRQETKSLRAGPFKLKYADGELRNVEMNGRRLLMRLYVAVRDRDWKTVPGVLTQIEENIEEDSFHIAFEMEHKTDDIHFVWSGTLSGNSNGTIAFSFDGEARKTFERNRIGFCLLFPAQFAGMKCFVHRTDGSENEAVFPVSISPDQPVASFDEMRGLALDFEDGLRFHTAMEGDVFEMEDQRNWTDASFKIFCTPLRLPFPVTVPTGTKVSQKITLSLETPRSLRSSSPPKAREITLALDRSRSYRLPLVGLGMSSSESPPDSRQTDRLRNLNPSHLRCEIPLSDANWKSELKRGILSSQALNKPLELALLFQENSDDRLSLKQLRDFLQAERVSIVRWVILPANESLTRPQPFERWLPMAQGILGEYFPGTPFIAGTNSDFIFLNRFPPPKEFCDEVSFALNPQVHAFDNQSLMESLEAQTTVVRSASLKAEGSPVHVSPVTLLPRFNPYGAERKRSTPPADPRQQTLFGAAWTLGSLCALVEGGAASVTYFETIGLGGVLENEVVFPLYHVLTDFNKFQGGEATMFRSGDSSSVVGMELTKERRRRILVANLTPYAQVCIMNELESEAEIRILDAESVQEACYEPEAFREKKRAAKEASRTLLLSPYATVCIDFKLEATAQC